MVSTAILRGDASDPIGLAGGLSTYAYVLGNPTLRIDPSGLYDLPPFERFLGELADATDVFGPFVQYVLPPAAAVFLGVNVGYAIDSVCAICNVPGEYLGGTIYQAANPYDPNIPTAGYATNPKPKAGPSSIDPFSVANTFSNSSSCPQ